VRGSKKLAMRWVKAKRFQIPPNDGKTLIFAKDVLSVRKA
jgi:hypothetical protein